MTNDKIRHHNKNKIAFYNTQPIKYNTRKKLNKLQHIKKRELLHKFTTLEQRQHTFQKQNTNRPNHAQLQTTHYITM